MNDRQQQIVEAVDRLGLNVLNLNRITLCDDIAAINGWPRDSVNYDEVVAALDAKGDFTIRDPKQEQSE